MPAPTYTRTNGANPKDADKGVWPRFYMDTIPDELESRKQGRRCFREEERVEIYMPGNNLNIPVFKVDDEHRQRWPQAYDAFKAGLEPPTDGIPLEEWPALNRAQILELKYLNFRTVENIAEASDLALQKMGMGARVLKDRAIAFLDDAARIALVEKTVAENQTNAQVIADQNQKIQEQGELLNQLQSRLNALNNAQPAIATLVPGSLDPIELAKTNPAAQTGDNSALASMRPSSRSKKAT